MANGNAGSGASQLGASLVLGAILFIVLFKLVRVIVPGDTGFLFASLIATYAGIAAPWLVVRFAGGRVTTPTGSHAPA